MKIVITGTSGLVGYDVWNTLKDTHELWGVGRKKPDYVPLAQWRSLDIVDSDLTSKTIPLINPDLVIHCAAVSNPDVCEADPATAYKANALGTRNLALACQKFDAEILFVSSDQVFNGKKKTPYTELDHPDPVNHYGSSKVWGEEYTKTLCRRYYVVRTALVFGMRRPTFVDRVVRTALSGGELVCASDIVNSPTYSKDLAKAISFLIEKHVYGTYHIANVGSCSRVRMARFIVDSLGKGKGRIKKGELKRLNLKAKRPGYSPLENFAWNLSGFPRLRTWEDALMEYLEEMPESG